MLNYIEERSIPEPNSGCWLWLGGLGAKGYGSAIKGGKSIGAHRLSYEIHCGPVPAGECVLHKCDVRTCVNPDHLFTGSNDDNVADKVAKGRQACGEMCNKVLVADEVRAIFHSPLPSRAAGKAFGVSATLVKEIRRGRIWKHLSLK